MVRVKAFLDGGVVIETKPRHLTEPAHRILNDIFDKYTIPYETETPIKMAKGPLILAAIFGIAVGALALNALLGSPEQK